jgi:hypothetical protein
MSDDEFIYPADVLRLIPERLQHSQLHTIEVRDPDFPRADYRPGRKPRYHKAAILEWIARRYPTSSGHVEAQDPAVLPKTRRKPDARS